MVSLAIIGFMVSNTESMPSGVEIVDFSRNLGFVQEIALLGFKIYNERPLYGQKKLRSCPIAIAEKPEIP
jgi:hypothetical protein